MPLSLTGYLRVCLFGPLLAFGAIIPFNYFLDPYGIFHPGQSWGGIHYRPAQYRNDYLGKAYAVQVADADLLFLGSSRVALGIAPLDSSLTRHGYNLALMGSGVYENWRYLQHAAAAHMPTTVVLGIDPDFFLADRGNCILFTEDRLSVTVEGKPNFRRHWADLGPALMSGSALSASYATLLAQSYPTVPDQRGYLGFFNGRKRRALDVWLDILKPKDNFGPYRNAAGQASQLGFFENILTFCALHHIRFIAYVHPLHATTLDFYTDDWQNYSNWLRDVVHAIESTPGLDGTLWDFSGYNQISTEPFPPNTVGDSTMKYYIEGSHYTNVVGDIVINRIFNGAGPENFGLRVTSSNVEDDLRRLLREQKAWHDHHTCVQLEPPP